MKTSRRALPGGTQRRVRNEPPAARCAFPAERKRAEATLLTLAQQWPVRQTRFHGGRRTYGSAKKCETCAGTENPRRSLLPLGATVSRASASPIGCRQLRDLMNNFTKLKRPARRLILSRLSLGARAEDKTTCPLHLRAIRTVDLCLFHS